MSDESVKQKASRYANNATWAKQKVVGSGSIILPFIVGVLVFFADISLGFARSGTYLVSFFGAYAVVGLVTYMSLRDTYSSKWLVKHCLMLTLISLLVPYLLSLLAGFLSQQVYSFAGFFLSDLVAKLTSGYAPIIFVYFLGWPKFLFDHAIEAGGGLGKVAGTINFVVIIVVFAAVLLPFMSALSESQAVAGLGVSGYEYEPISLGAMASDSWNVVRNTSSSIYGGVTGEVNNSFAQATQRGYTGQVERQQGQRLGVFIRDVSPAKRLYYVDANEDGSLSVAPGEQEILWYGTMEASTFADEMNVTLGCMYELSSRGENDTIIQGSARPSGSIVVRYTGQDFTDVYPFDCTVGVEEILEINSSRPTSGQFYTTADFPFETWGYATLTFMDAQNIIALRRDRQDPAQVVGVDRTVQAVYTPGPLSLGMFDRQPLPLRVDLQSPDSNFLPAFGVTLQNVWAARGEVTSFEQLILQLPEEFELDTEECAGYTGDVEHRTRGALVNNEEVPEGFRWYVFSDIEVSERDNRRTIRCPLQVRGGEWSRLLNPDLSAKQFSFVARASYNYSTRTRVPVSLGVARI